jgi:hypothetical protein
MVLSLVVKVMTVMTTSAEKVATRWRITALKALNVQEKDAYLHHHAHRQCCAPVRVNIVQMAVANMLTA